MTLGTLAAIRRPSLTGTGAISVKQAAAYLIIGRRDDAISANLAVTYLIVRP